MNQKTSRLGRLSPVQHRHAEDRAGHSNHAGLYEPPGRHLQLQRAKTYAPRESCLQCQSRPWPGNTRFAPSTADQEDELTVHVCPSTPTHRTEGQGAAGSVTSQLGGSGQGTPVLGKVMLREGLGRCPAHHRCVSECLPLRAQQLFVWLAPLVCCIYKPSLNQKNGGIKTTLITVKLKNAGHDMQTKYAEAP